MNQVPQLEYVSDEYRGIRFGFIVHHSILTTTGLGFRAHGMGTGVEETLFHSGSRLDYPMDPKISQYRWQKDL